MNANGGRDSHKYSSSNSGDRRSGDGRRGSRDEDLSDAESEFIDMTSNDSCDSFDSFKMRQREQQRQTMNGSGNGSPSGVTGDAEEGDKEFDRLSNGNPDGLNESHLRRSPLSPGATKLAEMEMNSQVPLMGHSFGGLALPGLAMSMFAAGGHGLDQQSYLNAFHYQQQQQQQLFKQFDLSAAAGSGGNDLSAFHKVK